MCAPDRLPRTFLGGAMKFQGIDGLRAIAVLSVIAAHSLVTWLPGGGLGVDVFFGISGFLITYLLIKEHRANGRISLPLFWLRRGLRLMPALLLMAAFVCTLAVVVFSHKPDSPWQVALHAAPSVLFYFGNWMIVATNSAALGAFEPLWSLAVEEQFYLAWPLIVMGALRLKSPLLVLGITGAALALAAAVNRAIVFDGVNMYRTFGTDFRLDMLLIGVLLAVVMHAGHEKAVHSVTRITALPSAIILAAAAILVPDFGIGQPRPEWAHLYYSLGLPIIALSTASIIGYLITRQGGRIDRALSVRPLAYTGKISYGMYLWHYPIILAVKIAMNPDPTVLLAIALALTYVAAGLSWKLVEAPLQGRYHHRLKAVPAPRHEARLPVG